MSSDLDAHLAGLASPERPFALAALDEVRERVWREGVIFEHTAAAVPALVERALDVTCVVRPPILQLLAFLFGGEGPTLMGLSRDEGSRGAAIQSRMALEHAWTSATRAAVRRPLPDYLALLADEDRDVRTATACLITVFHDQDAEPEVRRGLTRRYLEEPDEIVRATLLGSLNVYLPSSHLEIYDTALEKDESLLVRREAAHSLAAVLRDEASQLVAATLIEAILRAPELLPLYDGVAWNRRGIVADSLWAITRLGLAARGLLRYLEKLVRKVAPRDALDVAEASLLIAFERPAASHSLADLDPAQRSLLQAIVATDAIWGQELPRMLAHYGLPREQATLRAYLARS